MKKEKIFKLQKTQELIKVYRLARGGWCSSLDCKTEYKDSDFICNNNKPIEF